jgi:beta-lactamase regulating signal transducer with metallopeptidase domain
MNAFIPALLIKLTVILAVGLTVAAVLRSLSPSLRHLTLFATIASGVALPLVMLISPQWNVPVLPVSLSANGATSQSTANEQSNPFADSRLPGGITNAPLSGSALSARVIDAGIPQSRSAVRTSLIGLPPLPLLWALGFLAVLGWLATGRIRLRRIAAESWPLDGSDWNGILEEERRYAGVTKPVLLFSSSVVSTPLTWGSRAPIVLLPEDAIDWPEPHRRVVIRQDLAHN